MGNGDRVGARVVVGVDSAAGPREVSRWGALAATRRHAPVTLLHALGFPEFYAGHVAPPPGGFDDELRDRGRRILHEARQAAEAVAGSAAGSRVDMELSPDTAAAALVAASASARLVVLGSSVRGRITSLIGGSVTLAVAAHARCPVACVRGSTWDTPDGARRPVVVGVDSGPSNELALSHGFEEAAARGVELITVHAWGDDRTVRVFGEADAHFDWRALIDSERRLIAERLAGWHEKYPDVVVRQVIVPDRPTHELLRWSEKAQLVVVGSRGRGGFGGLLLGSTSQALLYRAACPVLVARPALNA